MFYILIEAKKRIMSLIKAGLAMAIIVILAVQLFGVIQDASDYYRRWLNRSHPHGNPLKVFKEVDDSVINGDDRILRKIKKDYKASSPVY